MRYLYSYEGPVMEFDRCIASKWRAETVALSKEKALSNLAFQFKKSHNKRSGASIRLTGTIKVIHDVEEDI